MAKAKHILILRSRSMTPFMIPIVVQHPVLSQYMSSGAALRLRPPVSKVIPLPTMAYSISEESGLPL